MRKQRMGSWRQSALFGLCGWGLPVGVLFAIAFWVESNPRPPFWAVFGLSVPLFAVGGVVFGILVWWVERLTAAPAEMPTAAEPPGHAPERGPPLRIAFESIGWASEESSVEVIDLAADFPVLFMMFANGNYLETRAVGESEDAIAMFRRLMTVSGFPRISVPPTDQMRLHRQGDEVYHGSAVVSLSPVPHPQLARGAPEAEPAAAPDPAT